MIAKTKIIVTLLLAFALLTAQFAIVCYFQIFSKNQMKFLSPNRDNECNPTIEERYLFDLRSIAGPCKHEMDWINGSARNITLQTFVNKTVVIERYINPVGEWSKVVVQTYSKDGNPKKIGGDSWRAVIRGEIIQLAFVVDRMDGTYDVNFRPFKRGFIWLELTLEYSMCDGVMNPPFGWFERGDIHGHFQEEGTLGVNGGSLQQSIRLLAIEVKRSNDGQVISKEEVRHTRQLGLTKKQPRCCMLVWDGFGNWFQNGSNHQWVGNSKQTPEGRSFSVKPYQKLWIFGDSIGHRWFNSASGAALCRKLFASCVHTFTYVYEFQKYDHTKIDVGKRFNLTRFMQPIRVIFEDPEMKNRSVLVINFGLHLVMSLNFSQCQKVVDEFAELVGYFKRKNPSNSFPLIVWKTTTFARLEQSKFQAKSHARFLTNHRVQLFNTYANWKFCSLGIHIYDVFIVTASHPLGSIDGLHYQPYVFQPAEIAFEDFLLRIIPK